METDVPAAESADAPTPATKPACARLNGQSGYGEDPHAIMADAENPDIPAIEVLARARARSDWFFGQSSRGSNRSQTERS